MYKRISISIILVVMLFGAVACSNSKKTTETTMGHGGTETKSSGFDFTKKPGKDFKARDPKLPPVEDGTTHKINLSASEKVLEIAPGVKQEMWVFNNEAPGPVIHGKIGDKFEVKITNDGKIGHSMDFHASYAAWDTQMKTINPGESIDYNFTAEKAGIWMYHCGTAPALHHIGNGMWGAVVIDPPDLAKVDYEYILLQGELYKASKEGKPADLAPMLKDQWDAIVFNGFTNQYMYDPIVVDANKRIRVWVLDGGPSENSSFHVVGTIFDTVYKEGNYTLKPGPGGSQALDLQPAQGGFVEFTLKHEGYYPIVTHKFSNASRGAMGLFKTSGAGALGAGASH